jgi:hypothetical protein
MQSLNFFLTKKKTWHKTQLGFQASTQLKTDCRNKKCSLIYGQIKIRAKAKSATAVAVL